MVLNNRLMEKLPKSPFEAALEEIVHDMTIEQEVTLHQEYKPDYMNRSSSYYFSSGLVAETKDFELWVDKDDIIAHVPTCKSAALNGDEDISDCFRNGCFMEKKQFEIRDKQKKLPTALCEQDDIHEALTDLCNVQQAFGEEEKLKNTMARYMNIADKIFPGIY